MDISLLTSILQKPQVYDHRVTHVQFVETHISLLFLTGNFVYKIKKPVNFGFLDFSSLAKRKIYCEEEVRLNSRLAPELYVGVVPICKNGSHIKIGGPGEVIEYAVKMQQFDPDNEFDKLLAKGKLTKPHIEQAASIIANFHATIAIADQHQPYGTAQAIQQPTRENIEQLSRLDEMWLSQYELDDVLFQLRSWTESQYNKLSATFEKRKIDGFIRECHGDLHLRNIVLHKNKVIPFDGIEFNKNLCWIDVVNDIAFLLMDLEDHDRADLSRILRENYFSTTGDYAGLSVLRYYLVYRAMVRAKVAALRLTQTPNEKVTLGKELKNYLLLALAFTHRQQPRIIIAHGLSGSGKTFLSQQLLENIDIIRIRSDVERKRITAKTKQQYQTNTINSGIYNQQISQKTYSHLLKLSDTIINAGYSVFVDAAFLKKSQRDLFFSYARENNVAIIICHCESDITLQRQRLDKRMLQGDDASEADNNILDHQLDSHEPLTIDEDHHTIRVNTNEQPSLSELVKWLKMD